MGKGRPKNIENTEQIPLAEAVERLRLSWNKPPGKEPYKRSTLQKKIHRRELRRYGPYHDTHVDWNEVVSLGIVGPYLSDKKVS